MKTAKAASTVMIVIACVVVGVVLHRLSAWRFDFKSFYGKGCGAFRDFRQILVADPA